MEERNEWLFRASIALIVVAIELIRTCFGLHKKKNCAGVSLNFETIVVGVCSILWLVGLAGYVAVPRVLDFARLEVAVSLRYVGIALALGALCLLIWVHRALGANFSSIVRVRDEQELVVSGPYRWVRHPMYAAFMPLMLGYALIS